MTFVIEVRGLAKSFGNVQAVAGVDFNVRKGELFGFLGPNGAGKTTMVRMLTGVLDPSEGTAAIQGHDIRTESLLSRAHLGVVPEQANVYLDLSVWRNFMLMAELHGVPHCQRVREGERLLEALDLAGRKGHKARTLSKGLRQRLMLCAALVTGPEILFLDEPTSGLDVASARLIRQIVRNLNGNGLTVFLTTHNMNEAEEMCSRVAIINQGRIVAIDTPERLRSAMQRYHRLALGMNSTAVPPEPDKAPGRLMMVKELANRFLAAQQANWRDPKGTLNSYTYWLGRFLKDHPRLRAADLTVEMFAAWKVSLRKRKYSHESINHFLTAVRSIFNFADDLGLLERVPKLRRIKNEPLPPVGSVDKPLYTTEQVHRLLEYADVQLKVMLFLGLNCGFGPKDIHDLTWKHIKSERVTLPRSKTGICQTFLLWPETIRALEDIRMTCPRIMYQVVRESGPCLHPCVPKDEPVRAASCSSICSSVRKRICGADSRRRSTFAAGLG